MPLPIRLLLVFITASFVAGQINHAIYRFAWNRRWIGPWLPAAEKAPSRHPTDRIPIIGWWNLQRESTIHGEGFWVRPLLIELAFPLAMVFLYLFEIDRGLYPPGVVVSTMDLHMQFLSHATLISLMMVATFIDIDEQTIPDNITVPGTFIGFGFAALFPRSLLPVWIPNDAPLAVAPSWLTQPGEWAATLDSETGLLIGIACLAAWTYAMLLPIRPWYRGSLVKRLTYLIVRISRTPRTKPLIGAFVLLAVLTALVWSRGDENWMGLLTSLVGMAVGGGIVWSVRVIAGPIVRKEAMGFGDVTVMGMIGAFLGWQASLIVFFVAPFFGAVIAIIQHFVTKDQRIAFGPFLCSAACFVIVCWVAIWERWGYPTFFWGWFVPVGIGVMLLFLAIALAIIQRIKRAF